MSEFPKREYPLLISSLEEERALIARIAQIHQAGLSLFSQRGPEEGDAKALGYALRMAFDELDAHCRESRSNPS
jgi:hypothetical protein